MEKQNIVLNTAYEKWLYTVFCVQAVFLEDPLTLMGFVLIMVAPLWVLVYVFLISYSELKYIY